MCFFVAEVFVPNTADVWFSLSRVVPVCAWHS